MLRNFIVISLIIASCITQACHRKEKILKQTSISIDLSSLESEYSDFQNEFVSRQAFSETYLEGLSTLLTEEGLPIKDSLGEYTLKVSLISGLSGFSTVEVYKKCSTCRFCVWGSNETSTSSNSTYEYGSVTLRYVLLDESHNVIDEEEVICKAFDSIVYDSDEGKCDSVRACDQYCSWKYVSSGYHGLASVLEESIVEVCKNITKKIRKNE